MPDVRRVARLVAAMECAAARLGCAMNATASLATGLATAPAAHPAVVGARKFLHDFTPLETVIDGLPTARGGLVAITGPTGSGKTTVCTALQLALRTGRTFAGREVTAGSVLVLAGENADDYAMHLLGAVQHAGLKPEDLSAVTASDTFAIVPGTFDVLQQIDYLDDVLARQGSELVAVFVDTSAAYNVADDENDNVAMRRHASALRELTTLPGKPTVFVLCHPTKNATRDNLTPRGGGAFLAEVDANLTLWKDEAGIVTLHWAGKIRGPTFEPIRFELVPVELEGKVDCRGRPISTVVAQHVADDRAQQLVEKEASDQDVLLGVMLRYPGKSVRDLAMKCGWTNGLGKALSTRVDRRLKALQQHGLVEQDRKGQWRLTNKGQKEAEALR